MARDGTVTVRITGDTSGLSRALGETDSKLSKLGGVAKKGLAVTAGAVAAFAANGAKSFSEFQASMNEVFTLLPDISKKEMGKMTGDVKNFAKEFGVLPDKVIPALYQSLSAGVPQKNVFAFMEQAQKLAKGGVTDLTVAVDGLSSVTNAYGEEMISAEQASDILFTTVKLGKTTVGEMSANLSNVIPAAAAVGVKFEEVGAAIAALTAQGVPTAQATTQIRAAIVELTKEGTKVDKSFRKISGKSFPDFIKQGGSLEEALILLEKEAGKSNLSMLDMFGSVEAGQAALALTGRGADTFKGNLEAMGGAAGATDQAFATMDSGMASTMDKLTARVKVMSIDVGEKIASIGPMWLSLGLQAAASSGRVLTAFGAIVAGAAHMALSAVRSIVVFIAHWVLLGAQSLLAAAKVAAAWLIALGPIGLVVAAVIAAVGLIVIHWDKISAAAAAVWGWLKTNWPTILAVLTGPFGLAVLAIVRNWDTIKDGARAVKDWVVARFNELVGFITGLPGRFASAASGAWNWLIDGLKEAWEAVKRFWNSLPAITIDVPDILPGPDEYRIGFPRFHQGGIVPGRPGSEMLGLLQAGERIIPRGGAAGGGSVNHYTIAVTAIDPAAASEAVITAIKEFERRNGSGWRVA